MILPVDSTQLQSKPQIRFLGGGWKGRNQQADSKTDGKMKDLQ